MRSISLFLLATAAWANTCSLSTPGTYNLSQTAGQWTGTGCTGIPGLGDTTTIATGVNLIIDQDWGIGLDGPTGGTAAILIQGTGTVTLASGHTLFMHGDITNNQQNVAGVYFTAQAGSGITCIAGAGVNYRIGGSQLNTFKSFVAAGTWNSHVTIQKTGAGTCQFGRGGVTNAGGALDLTYTDLYDFGADGLAWADLAGITTGSVFNFQHCTFTRCGFYNQGTALAGSTVFRFDYNIVSDSKLVNTAWLIVSGQAALTTGTREIVGNYFDTYLSSNINLGGFTVTDNYFKYGLQSILTSAPAAFRNNVIRGYPNPPGNPGQTWVLNISARNGINQNYFLIDYEKDNPHFLQVDDGQEAWDEFTDGNVFEFTALSYTGHGDVSGDLILTGTTSFELGADYTLTQTGTIAVPSGTGYSPGTLVTTFGYGFTRNKWIGNHNTYFTGTYLNGYPPQPANATANQYPVGGAPKAGEGIASGTLTAGITATDTSISLSNIALMGPATILNIEGELVYVCAASAGTVTIGASSCPNVDGRGYNGTTAAPHLSGVSAIGWILPGSIRSFKNNLGWNNLPNGEPGWKSAFYTEWDAPAPNGAIRSVDVTLPADADYNGQWNSYPGNVPTWTNAGCGYMANWSVPCGPGGAGEHDLIANPYLADTYRGYPLFATKYAGQSSSTVWENGATYHTGDLVLHSNPNYYQGRPFLVRAVADHVANTANQPGYGGVAAVLDGAITNSQTSIPLLPGSNITLTPAQPILVAKVQNEMLAICAFDPNTNIAQVGATTCPNVNGRGYDGTVAASHASGQSVQSALSWRCCWEFASGDPILDLYRQYVNGRGITDGGIGCIGCSPAAALRQWVKRGYTPQDRRFCTAGSGGDYIGAVPCDPPLAFAAASN